MAAVEQHKQYRRELQAGALIRISSELLEMKGKKARFLHRMYNADTGEEAASSELVALFIDTDSRRAVPFPEEILQRAGQVADR